MGAHAQSAGDFVARYQVFVDSVASKKAWTDAEAQWADSTYDAFTEQYHATYKPLMTNDQLTSYTACRTRYLRLRMGRKTSDATSDLGESVDSVSEKVAKGTKKTVAKVKGFMHGLFSGSKK